MSAVAIRPARRADAAALARLGNELARLMNAPESYSAKTFARYGFGPNPHFEVLVAEAAGEIVGYALFEEMFNTDLCEPGIWLHDIMVGDAARGAGVGTLLMAAVARAALERGRSSIWWAVLVRNAAAKRFYERLGALDDNAQVMELHGEGLRALANSTQE